MATVVTRAAQLVELTAGAWVKVRGRYEASHVDMRPTGEEPKTVFLILEDGGRVLVGAYGTEECVRADHERSRLEGKTVTVSGSFHATAPYPHAGPPPAMWTGGGPQLHDVKLTAHD